MTAEELIVRLQLSPLPGEGGYFRQTYLTGHSSAIYYLLTPDCHSRLHVLTGDEVYHFYLGDPVELLTLHADGTGAVTILGPDLVAEQVVQRVVPAGVWQGSRLIAGGRFALMGTTMAPPFDPSGCVFGDGPTLVAAFPRFADRIAFLSRENS